MTIEAKTYFASKSIFVSPVFTMGKKRFSTFWQKPSNPALENCTLYYCNINVYHHSMNQFS